MQQYVRLTGVAKARLGLSFYEASDIPEKRLFVCPPILRRQLFELKPDPNGKHLLVYLLNHGYAADILSWHRRHPEIPIHCFYDKPGAPPEEAATPGFTFHALDGQKFLRLMAAARAVVCTAGFESVSEAVYLGKRLMMVPVQNHVEQSVNAQDAAQAGLGIHSDCFDLDRLFEPFSSDVYDTFRRWVDRAAEIAVRVAEQTAGLQASSPVNGRLMGASENPGRQAASATRAALCQAPVRRLKPGASG
jgi:uncharacterized protein (TIGR00661 family)